MTPPPGFEAVPTGLGFTDNLQPLFRRVDGQWPEFGLVVSEPHLNMMGVCHGAALMCLADISAASGINTAAGKTAGSPTINLAVDFIAAGKRGEWLQSSIDHVSLRRRFGFCAGVIEGPGGLVARFNGTFYLPDHKGVWKGPVRDAGGVLGVEPEGSS
ncbi:hypothetical protein GCM10007053_12260 [Halioglobus pacificus]|uniref:Thioesterase domain-containing protein n=2 Tax=Parahalioglobus pacificus TaxID=930806 RepID=A0A919CJP3_9GAMM|nr:hypothetical protein GCM10007053_12260 [Halioglobus pacificus]